MQAQNTCSTAIPESNSQNGTGFIYNQHSSVNWIYFIAGKTDVSVNMTSINNNINTKISLIKIYSGTCNNLQLIGSDSASNPSDSILNTSLTNLTINSIYYMEIFKQTLVDTAKYLLSINSQRVPSCGECNLTSQLSPCELICNPSFESSINNQQPTGFLLPGGSLITCGWENATGASPDYYTTAGTGGSSIPNTGIGTQTARTGNAMVGFFANSQFGWHEYLYYQLTQPLVAGKNYEFSFYVKPSNTNSHYSDGIGAYFTDMAEISNNSSTNGLYPYLNTPQINSNTIINDNQNWTRVSGILTANGTEMAIVIGSFNNSFIQSYAGVQCYYFLDDISLTPASGKFCDNIQVPTANNIPANSSASSVFGAATTITNQNFRISGTFTINQNTTFAGCNLVMGADSKIIVNSGVQLLFNGKSHVYGCCSMWEGIQVNNGGSARVEGHTIIEDAKNAITVVQGGNCISDLAIFNKNYSSITLLTNSNSSSPLTISRSLFTSRDLQLDLTPSNNPNTSTIWTNINTYPTTVCKYNSTTTYTEKSIYGINATDVNTINIGNGNIANYFNAFDELKCGINLTRTNAIIYNNKFQNLLSLPCFPCTSVYGFGIKTQGTATGNYSITIGGTGTIYQPNSFSNCYRAMELNDYKMCTVKNNTITNSSTSTGINYGNTGLLIKPANGNTLSVSNNVVTNCNNAVWINRSTTGNINSQGITIENNTINSNPSGFCTNGVNISDVSNSGSTTPVDKIKIQYNTITQAYNCVTATNVKNSLVIRSNTQLQVKNNGTAVNAIKLSGCKGVKIHDNQNINISPVYSPVNITPVDFKGIFVTGSTENQITCNKISNMGESMTYVGSCINSTLRNNTLDKGNRGFVLRNNGEVGAQGTPNPNGIPCGLWWSAVTTDFTAHTYTENTNTPNNLSKLYVNSTNVPAGFTGIPTVNSFAPASTPYSVVAGGINTVSGSPISCSTIIIQMAPVGDSSASAISSTTTTNETTLLTSLATDESTYPVYEEEHQYNHKKYAFEKLEANGAISNATLQNFYDSTQVETMGKLKQVDDALKLNDAALASALNSSLFANNVVENNQKVFNTLYLNYLNNNEYIFTQTEKDELFAIAEQCPLEGGSSVWQARVLYSTIENDWTEFADNCNTAARQMTVENTTTVDQTDTRFKLYPNPNNGQMILEYTIEKNEETVLNIYDIAGKLISTYLINSNNKKIAINENSLDGGIYYYSISVNGKSVKSDKLVIIK